MQTTTNPLKAVTTPSVDNDDLFKPNVRVRTRFGETGTVVGPHYAQKDWYNVRIDGSFDTQNPPRWIGELVESYQANELTVLA